MNQDEIKEFLPSWILRSRNHYLIITDLEGNYIFVNDLFQKRFSFISDNFIGLSAQNSVHPEDLEKCATASLECINKPDAVVNLKIRKPDGRNTGEYCETDWEFSLFADKNKKPIGILCLGHDTTEISKQSRIIIESENKLRAILDSSSDSNILISPDLKILSFNKSANVMTKHFQNRELIELASILDYIPSENRKDFEANTKKALLGNKISIEKEISFGELSVWIEASYVPVYNSKNEIIAVTCNSVNITKRKKAEEDLKRSEYLLNVIYNSSAEAHTLLDKDLKILYMNKVARSVLLEVFDREAKIGDDSLDFMLPQLRDEFRGYYKRVLKGEVIRVEKLHEGKWWLFSLFPAYDDTANLIGISHNVLDITDRKSGEFKIANQNDKLKEIAWQQSHNVRQKVANILGLCNLFLEDKELSEEDKEKNIEFILHSAKELDRIIHEIVKNTEDSQYNI
jgi:PAS domain S-box-containing protein